MGCRLKWENHTGFAECHEGYVEQGSEGWWDAYMNYTTAAGSYGSRELGTFLTKKDAMDRVEAEFEQTPSPPCKVLVKDGHRVVEATVSRSALSAGTRNGPHT